MELKRKKISNLNDNERYMRDRASVMSMLKFILAVAIIIGLCYVGKIVAVILVPFLIGFILSKTSLMIAKPVSKLFSKDAAKIKPGKKKSVQTKTALIVYAILNVLAILLIILICIGLAYQANSFLSALVRTVRTFDPSEMLNATILDRFSVENGGFLTVEMMTSLEENISGMVQTVANNIPKLVSEGLSALWEIAGNLPYAVFFVISIILSGFYFINDGPAVMKFFVKNTPNRNFRNRIITLLNELSYTVFRVLGGYFVLFVITACESFVVFFAAGLREYAIILSIITALIDFLPLLGISITMIPTLIYLILHEQYVAAIIVAIGYVVMSVIRRFIEPAILGKTMHMHPLITLVSMAAGVYIWGASGFLLGPILAIIIIQVIKVFEIDKSLGKYFSGVLDRFMKDKEDLPEENKEDVETQKS